jgi:hypothetical protein
VLGGKVENGWSNIKGSNRRVNNPILTGGYAMVKRRMTEFIVKGTK